MHAPHARRPSELATARPPSRSPSAAPARSGGRAPRDGAPAGPGPHRLYAHLAWTTLARLPLVAPRRRASVETLLLSVCRRVGVVPLEVCVLENRLHLLVRFAPAQTLDDVARRLKRASEEALRAAGLPVRWGAGYGAVTVSPGEVRRVMRRIAGRGERADGRATASRRPVDGGRAPA